MYICEASATQYFTPSTKGRCSNESRTVSFETFGKTKTSPGCNGIGQYLSCDSFHFPGPHATTTNLIAVSGSGLPFMPNPVDLSSALSQSTTSPRRIKIL